MVPFEKRSALWEESLTKLYTHAATLREQTAGLSQPVLVGYERRGIGELYDGIDAVRAAGQSAAWWHGEALRTQRAADNVIAQARLVAQMRMDDEAVKIATMNPERWSWEERASKARTRMLDVQLMLRELEDIYTSVCGEVLAVETMARNVTRWRQDVTAQIDVVRFGEKLREV